MPLYRRTEKGDGDSVCTTATRAAEVTATATIIVPPRSGSSSSRRRNRIRSRSSRPYQSRISTQSSVVGSLLDETPARGPQPSLCPSNEVKGRLAGENPSDYCQSSSMENNSNPNPNGRDTTACDVTRNGSRPVTSPLPNAHGAATSTGDNRTAPRLTGLPSSAYLPAPSASPSTSFESGTPPPNRRVSLPQFERDRGCTACGLHEGVESVCIPSRLFASGPPGTSTAVYIVGEAPGSKEDEQDETFVGASGVELDSWVFGAGFSDCADVFVGNAVRCHPSGNATPTKGQRTTCLRYLLSDLDLLSKSYTRIVILAVGSSAIASLAPRAEGESADRNTDWMFKSQGYPLTLFNDAEITLFGTYHPAFCLRDPAKRRSVRRHLMLVKEFLSDGRLTEEAMPPVQIAPPVPPGFHGRVSFDFETYGLYKCISAEQTQFHPIKMLSIDRVVPDDVIVCASIHAWLPPSLPPPSPCGQILGYFKRHDPRHWQRFLDWLSAASSIGGQNLQFDLKVGRAFGPGFAAAVPVWTPLIELLIESFTADDLAPERSLKARSLVNRVTSYSDDEMHADKRYDDADDPLGIEYAAKDAWATDLNIDIEQEQQRLLSIEEPAARPKISSFRAQWSSDQVWCAVLLEEWGAAFDIASLEHLHQAYTRRFNELLDEGRALGVVLAGAGSESSIRAVVQSAIKAALDSTLDAYGDGSPEHGTVVAMIESLEYTDKGVLSCAADNVNRILGAIIRGRRDDWDKAAFSLSLLSELTGLKKLITSYTRPLLYGKQSQVLFRYEEVPTKSKTAKNPTRRLKIKGSEHYKYDRTGALVRCPAPDGRRLGFAYPAYFLNPKSFDEGGLGGGVRETRWSAKSPPIQTLPKAVRRCMTTRYTRGLLLCWDLKQAEWRMGMWLPDDRRGLEEIATGADMHAESARILVPEIMDNTEGWIASDAGRRTLLASPNAEIRRAASMYYVSGTYDPSAYDGKPFHALVWKHFRDWAGKTPNFAELYGAQAITLQVSIRAKTGVEVPLHRVERYIQSRERLYPQRAKYREWLMEQAFVKGALFDPVLGGSRSFGDGMNGVSRDDIEHLYREQILDFLVQYHASKIMMGAMHAMCRAITSVDAPVRVVTNWHDGLPIDCRFDYWEWTAGHMAHYLTSEGNEYLARLEQHEGRKFPIAYDADVLASNKVSDQELKQVGDRLNAAATN